MHSDLHWIAAFLDYPAADFDSEIAFWSAVTGYATSPSRGEFDEYATLLPQEGDAFLKVQRIDEGPARIHLDLHVADPTTASSRAVELGASIEVRSPLGYVVLGSPGGFTFCFVSGPASVRPAPTSWPEGHASIFDQVCLDIPAEGFDVECRFWTELTGWELRASPVSADFRGLVRPPQLPIRLLLQRLGEPTGPVRAHPDLACSDRDAETARHLALGAELVSVHPVWSVLRTPGGSAYCLTDRNPETGLLDP